MSLLPVSFVTFCLLTFYFVLKVGEIYCSLPVAAEDDVKVCDVIMCHVMSSVTGMDRISW